MFLSISKSRFPANCSVALIWQNQNPQTTGSTWTSCSFQYTCHSGKQENKPQNRAYNDTPTDQRSPVFQQHSDFSAALCPWKKFSSPPSRPVHRRAHPFPLVLVRSLVGRALLKRIWTWHHFSGIPSQHLAVTCTETYHSITQSCRLEGHPEVICSNLLGPITVDCSGFCLVKSWTPSRTESPKSESCWNT